MAANKGWVSQSEAARREEVSQPYIAKLIKQKRLKTNAKKQVRLAELRAVRAFDLDPARGKHKPQKQSAPGGSPEQELPTSTGFTAARTRREEQMAYLAELDVRQRLGELVEWDKIEALNASTAVMIRESLLAIPDRLASVLAAESEEKQIRAMIDNEIRAALAHLAAGMRKPG